MIKSKHSFFLVFGCLMSQQHVYKQRHIQRERERGGGGVREGGRERGGERGVWRDKQRDRQTDRQKER